MEWVSGPSACMHQGSAEPEWGGRSRPPHLHSTQLHFNNRGQLTRNRLAEGIHKLLMIVGEKCAEVVGALWINLGDQALWPSPWGLLYIP